jgi:hypothetical protein
MFLSIESIQFNALRGCLSGAIIISDAMMSVPTKFITINNNDLTLNARCLRAFFCLSSGVSAKHHTQNVGRLFGRKCEDGVTESNHHIVHFYRFTWSSAGALSHGKSSPMRHNAAAFYIDTGR